MRNRETAREIWVADSETDPFDGETIVRPFVWGCYNGSEYHRFDTTDEFIEFITEGNEKIVYAHNGGRFDWFFVLSHLQPWDPIQVINGRLARFRIGSAEFRDSYNILPSPLSAYKKDEIDYRLFTASQRMIPANRLLIDDYLRSDCVYLYQFVHQFIDDYGVHLTFASAALDYWSKQSGIEKPTTDVEFFRDLSRYYYGGRVECRTTGVVKRNIYCIDVNSAYSHAGNHLHPWGETYNDKAKLPSDPAALGRCFITLEGPSKGALPFRTKTGLVFPADGEKREFHVTGWEFLAARETGFLPWYTIKRVITFPLTINFRAYNDHFFALKATAKANGDKARYEFSKFFLNGLTGKFGANPETYEEFMVIRPQFIDAARTTDHYEFCAILGAWALVSRPLPESKRRYYNVATVASITGFQRALLWRTACACEGVHYMDTDCLHVEKIGDGVELHPTKLGAWDIEAQFDMAAYAGKKLYAGRKIGGGWKLASKGVRLTAGEIVKVALGRTVKYKPQAPSFSLKSGTKFVARNVTRQK